ncbi:hypothetical protein J4Q44_G00045860 [Coregonus suidteri]|uniref:Uncharacterized protein n=1 Tax=Coregonus suidteri TaxID=861788 RepID=A0AAN8M906_9TELE
MSKLELLRVIFNQRCTGAADETFRAVAKMISEYQDNVYLSKEDNDRVQGLLDIILKPEIKLYRADFEQFIVSEVEFPPEQQYCEQEWSPSLGQDGWNSIQIKEEQDASWPQPKWRRTRTEKGKSFISSKGIGSCGGCTAKHGHPGSGAWCEGWWGELTEEQTRAAEF